MATLAATMKSSMSCRARFLGLTTSPFTVSPSISALASIVSSGSAPRSCRRSRKIWRGGDLRRRGALFLEPGADRVVVELGVVADEGGIDVMAPGRAVGGHDDVDHHRPPVDALAERRQVGAECLRQHREDGHPGVDRGRVPRRVGVDGGAGADQAVDVGDRHAHVRVVSGERLGHLDLVEVARLHLVDRGPEKGAQVAHARRGCGVRGSPDSGDLRLDFGLEVGPEAAIDHRLAGRGSKVDVRPHAGRGRLEDGSTKKA